MLFGCTLTGVWELLTSATGSIPEWMLPAPSSIVVHVIDNADLFLVHTRTTCIEFLIGYATALVLGVLWGVVLSQFRIVREASYPYVIILGALPAAAFAPIANIWFGYGLVSKAIVAAAIAIFPVVTSTVTGIQTIPREAVEAAMLDGAGGFVLVSKILLPLALPSIMIGMRIAWAGAIIGAITSEIFGAVRGLGYAIQFGLRMSRVLDIFAATGILSILSVTGYLILRTLEKRFSVTMWVSK